MTSKRSSCLHVLKTYDVIGFDLDNTLARYKLDELYYMIYSSQVDYLVTHKNWNNSLLERYEPNKDFIVKGNVYDIVLGNLLKLNEQGEISVATHGTKLLTNADVISQYPGKKTRFHEDLMNNYSSTKKFRIFENAFDVPSSLLCALMVDDCDEYSSNVETDYKVTYEKIWHDVLSSLIHIFDYQNFALQINSYFPNIKREPDLYVYKLDSRVIQVLNELKNEGKVLFLMTSSYADYAEFILNHIFDFCDWSSYFELVLYFARKPTCFFDEHPYYEVENAKLGRECRVLTPGTYSHGNSKILNDYFVKRIGTDKPKVVYFGDSVRSDIFPVRKYADWMPWCVIEEQGDIDEASADTSKRLKMSKSCPSSFGNPWGSIYSCYDGSDTLWYSIIKKFCGHPSLQYLSDLK